MDEPDPVSSPAEPQPVHPSKTATADEAPGSRSRLRWVVEVVAIVAAAFVLALLIQQFAVKPYTIPSESMEPTLVEGDRVLVSRLTYLFRDPQRGDVIVFRNPNERDGDPPLIKRVVAVAGDTVSVHGGVLWVNGQAQEERFIKEHPILDGFPDTRIEPGYVWAMGDNRNDSGDSRRFGPVSEDSIIGLAFAIYWPPGDIGGL